jgi:osmoprotectant transport system ATP-binding protein
MGDRIAILREGGVLAQYDTPDAILARPADEFVEQFVGEDRALRRLALRRVGDIELDAVGNRAPPPDIAVVPSTTTVRNAVSLMLQAATDRVLVAGDDGEPRGVLRLERVEEILK